jgi:hypothetical protein
MSVKFHSATRRAAHVLLIAGLLLLAPACSDDPAVTPELCISFLAADQPGQGRVTARLDADSECQVAEIEIIVTDVDDVFAFTSTITYDIDVVTYLGYSLSGSVLQSGGTDVAVNISENDDLGTLTVGATRLSDTGIDVVGTELLIKLAFSQWALTTASGAFTLDATCLLDSGSGQEPELMGDVACSGGTISVR